MPYRVICPECNGKGYVLELSIGVGNQQLVTAWVQVTCWYCGGAGFWHED